jgi:hypothetical protein
VVDDVNDRGAPFRAALDHLAHSGAASLRTAGLHAKSTTAVPAPFRAIAVHDWHWILYRRAVVEDVSGFLRRLPRSPTVDATWSGLTACAFPRSGWTDTACGLGAAPCCPANARQNLGSTLRNRALR